MSCLWLSMDSHEFLPLPVINCYQPENARPFVFIFAHLRGPPAVLKFIHASFRGQISTRSKTYSCCWRSERMASRSRLCVYLFLGALLPTFANCIRPFRVPTNLFVQGTSPHTLPEGIREIRSVREPEERIEDAETFEGLHNRFRRSVSNEPTPNITSVNAFLSLWVLMDWVFLNIQLKFRLLGIFICPLQQSIGSFDSLYMYWPSNSGNENVIFLLGKTKDKSTDKIFSSKVLVSKDYGKSFGDLDGVDKTRRLIDQIYCSTVDPKLVSTSLITYPCACSF